MVMTRLQIPLLALSIGLSACGGGDSTTPNNNQPPPPAQANDIKIVVGASTLTTTAFNPNPKVVTLGSNTSITVRWINNDISGGDYQQGTAVIHNITSDNSPADFAASGTLVGNATYSATFDAVGDYPYHCSIHPNMVGTVRVEP
jgi:plastocyanin